MQNINTNLEFINHASVLISNNDISLLSDPWYQGEAFHKGWNLLHELQDEEIYLLLDRTTHIWISHEHPDHFSIMFFKKFGNKIKEKNIEILFQATTDKRVESFLRANSFSLKILKPNTWTNLSDDFSVLNFKDGFYDSGLAMNVCGRKFLNLNDCEIKTEEKCKNLLNLVGECDVLISQFSYAAWKGGIENLNWRKKAAEEKLDTLALQVNHFKPKLLIPFASYVYFSNVSNFYLNDSANKPIDVIDHFKNNSKVNVKVMKPFEIIDNFDKRIYSNDVSLNFWDESYKKIDGIAKNSFDKVDFYDLDKSFQEYKARIFKNNSKMLIKLIKIFSPIPAFKPIIIHLDDINKIIQFDIFEDNLKIVDLSPDITMSSESFEFILKNTFGFDTLTVNGCFEENAEGGFIKMTKTMAIENLNNIGIYIKPSIIARIDIIFLFLSRLFVVKNKIKNPT